MSTPKKTKLVLKNIRSGKQASSQDAKLVLQLKADELNSLGFGGGIVDALLPQTAKEKAKLTNKKINYKVAEVESRATENSILRDYFQSNNFMVALGQWFQNYHQNAGNFTIERITTLLEASQKTLIDSGAGTDPKLLDLQNIFTKYAPELFYIKRKKQWWEAGIKSRKRRKT